MQQAKRAAWVERSRTTALWERLLQDDAGDSGAPEIPEHAEERFIKLKQTSVKLVINT